MKNNGEKVIGFRQKVPYQILENGLYLMLRDGNLNSEAVKRDLQEYFSGENRMSKAATTVSLVIKKNSPTIIKLNENLSAEEFLRLSQSDRFAGITSLLCLAYPFVYEALITAATIFKIQDCVTRDLLHQKMTAIYGSNRAVYIGIGEMLSTFIELELFERKKNSLYSKTSQKLILNPFISELFIYTDIKLSCSKTILVEDLKYRPWYSYYLAEYQPKTKNSLVQYSDGNIGNGYLTLKNNC